MPDFGRIRSVLAFWTSSCFVPSKEEGKKVTTTAGQYLNFGVPYASLFHTQPFGFSVTRVFDPDDVLPSAFRSFSGTGIAFLFRYFERQSSFAIILKSYANSLSVRAKINGSINAGGSCQSGSNN